jgi:hypothetical protein
MVEIRYPPPTRNISPQFFELKPGTTIQRIFDPTSYGATAINFRYFGALSRFDHQRCDPADVSSAKASVRDAPEGANPLGRSWSSLKGLASRRASRQRHSKAVDEDRGIIYAGFNLSCCLIEVFGDDEEIKIRQQQIAYITLTESVMLLDLRESGAWDAGSTASMPFDGRRKLTQAWSRYFYYK